MIWFFLKEWIWKLSATKRRSSGVSIVQIAAKSLLIICSSVLFINICYITLLYNIQIYTLLCNWAKKKGKNYPNPQPKYQNFFHLRLRCFPYNWSYSLNDSQIEVRLTDNIFKKIRTPYVEVSLFVVWQQYLIKYEPMIFLKRGRICW